jgi:UDP-N-acetylglucosamine 2-epimerase (non-hydrolysing)
MVLKKKKKILIVFGTRPEAIKMAPVIKVLSTDACFEIKICITAQHREMLDQVMHLFQISPDYDLNLMQPGQDLTDLTSRVLIAMRNILGQWRPDMLLVHGDTTTTMATSLAAYYQKIPVGHVEAGLRSGNIYSPFPEEMNRSLTTAISALHFAPTQNASNNLLESGVASDRIYITGNTIIDALFEVDARIRTSSDLRNKLAEKFHYIDPNKKLILVTGHRRENFGEGFENVCFALRRLASRSDVQIIFPVHLNPNVQEPVRRILSGLSNIYLVDPVEYLSFVYLMRRCDLILTDSGGIQEEAPSFRKPVLVMRDTTERPEAISSGAARLVGTKTDSISNEVTKLLENSEAYASFALASNPYGDGLAAERIHQILRKNLII